MRTAYSTVDFHFHFPKKGTVADNGRHPGLRSAERGDLFVPRTRATARKTELLHRSSSNSLELTAASPSLHVHQSQLYRIGGRPPPQ